MFTFSIWRKKQRSEVENKSMLEIEPLEVWVLDNSAPKGWKIDVHEKGWQIGQYLQLFCPFCRLDHPGSGKKCRVVITTSIRSFMDIVMLIGFDTKMSGRTMNQLWLKHKFLPKMLVHHGAFKYFWRLFLGLIFL